MAILRSSSMLEITVQEELEEEEASERSEIEKGISEAKAAVAQVKECLERLDTAEDDSDVQNLQVSCRFPLCCSPAVSSGSPFSVEDQVCTGSDEHLSAAHSEHKGIAMDRISCTTEARRPN